MIVPGVVGLWNILRGPSLPDALPLVSCVCLTTSPHRAAFLPDALRSYRQQSYTPRELLIVNDGDPIQPAAPDVRVVNLPDRGYKWSVGEKRNVGVRYAQGDYLATWDDDDVSLPWRLAVQMDAALAWNADVVLADCMYIADASMNLAGNCNRGRQRAVMASALAKRNAIVRAGGYEAADYMEDVGMLERIRLVSRGHVATMRDCDWYVMRRHAGNVTLDAGETAEQWLSCGLRNPDVASAAVELESVLAGPGGEDVMT